MSPHSIREYAARLRPHYAFASRREKGRILTEVCRVTGYHRKAAIRLLHPPAKLSGRQKRKRGRLVQYGPPVAQALQRLWEASDYLGSKRLAPFLPELLRVLDRQGELRLPPRVMIDVATGWTVCRAVWGAGQGRVGGAIHHVAAHLPFPLQALHTDNGSEFINRGLLPWCRRHGVQFTRGRPGRKNDQAYAEQRIWTVIRRFVGYDRYRTRPAYDQLNRLYDLLGLYLNFFQPLSKVISKVRHGARVTKRYDRAQTPYQRLLTAGVLSPEQQEALEATYLRLNPVRLRQEIQETQARLWKLAEPSPR